MKGLALALVLCGGPAVAFAEEPTPDGAGAGAPAAATTGVSAPARALPAAPSSPGNDFRLKTLFKVDVDYRLDDASVSDAAYARSLALSRPTAPGAVDGQAAALNARADYLSSDHVLGTEGLGWSHLRTYYHGYLLYRFEGYGGAPSPTFPTAYLSGSQRLAYDVRSAYGEVDGFKDQGFWSKVYLRAGRQWRYGAGVATFDGVTVGYHADGGELSLWGGRRSQRFLDDLDPGFVAGADGKLHLERVMHVPVDLGVDYLLYAAPSGGQAGQGYGVHHTLLVEGIWRRRRSGDRVVWTVSTYDFGGMRGYVAWSRPVVRTAQVKLFYDVLLGRDVTYDYISGHGFTGFSRFFYLPEPHPRSRIGLRWDHAPIGWLEYALFANFNIIHGGGNETTTTQTYGWAEATAFDATYEELGAIARLSLLRWLTPEAEYRVRFDQRQAENGQFNSTAGEGEHLMQEVRADLRWRLSRGPSLVLGALYRVYDFASRYAPSGSPVIVSNDSTVAGELQGEYWLRRNLQLKLRYEIGTDSRVFAPELGLIQSLYAMAGGRF